jgi:hypothetical protein
MRPYLEKTLHKKGAGGVARGVGPEFKLQYCARAHTHTHTHTHTHRAPSVTTASLSLP